MKIFTYFSATSMDLDEQLRLLILWRQNVTAFGHEPVVLNESHARRHPHFKEFDEYVRTLDTANDPLYERACFLRHAAMASLGAGVHVLSDYDVFHTSQIDGLLEKKPTQLHGYQLNCPCFVQGRAAHFEEFMNYVFGNKPTPREIAGKQHVSDQYCFEDFTGATKTHLVMNFGEDGWKGAPLIHFAHSATVGHRPRHRHIPELLEASKVQ